MTSSAEALLVATSNEPDGGALAPAWVIDQRRLGLRARLAEMRQYRHVLRFLAGEALQRMYRRTVLGKVWIVLRILLPVVVAAFVFGSLLRIPSHGVPYFLFFLAGRAQFGLFGYGLNWATKSMIRNRKLIRQMYFPRLFVPLAALAPAGVFVALELAVLALTLAYYRIALGRSYLGPLTGLGWMVLSLLLMALLTFFISLWTSVLAARFRDVLYIVRYLERGIFLLTPVLYPLSAVPAHLSPYVRLNPLAGLSEAFRYGLFGIGSVSWTTIVPALGAVTVAGITSLRFFFRVDASIADQI